MVIDEMVILEKITLKFGSTGLWSDAPEQDIEVVLVADYAAEGIPGSEDFLDCTYLEAHFCSGAWDVSSKGLIYTDRVFEEQLNIALAERGYPRAYYSEQGMQGDDFVHFDWEMSDKLRKVMKLVEGQDEEE